MIIENVFLQSIIFIFILNNVFAYYFVQKYDDLYS